MRLNRNAKRGTGEAMRNIMVRLSPEQIESAKERAAAMTDKLGIRVTLSDVLRLALREHLDRVVTK
jgi:hypothetical protein